MLLLKRIAFIVFFIGIQPVSAQETISVMYYNLLKFPNVNASRISYLQEIVNYVAPDILVVNELSSASGASSILNNALNTNGVTHYAAATYVDGPDDENMLYYNSDKLGLVDENVIPTSLRDINEYVLYYKNPTLTATSDTAYLYMYGVHLKAGTNTSDENQRTAEASVLKSYLAIRPNAENTIVGGDFNIYYSTEGAYNQMTGSTQANLHDVIGVGSYHNNNIFAAHFTQSTRLTSFDGGSTGGMDDRFDFMFFSDDMLSGQNGVRYVDGSYTAIGQDGLRYNSSLISPANSSEPSNIINALYYMSDHIPVYMELEAGGNIGLNEAAWEKDLRVFPVPANNTVNIASGDAQLQKCTLRDIQGRKVLEVTSLAASNYKIDVANLTAGTYFLTVETDLGKANRKIIVE